MSDSPKKKPQLSAANLPDMYVSLSGHIRQWADSLGLESEYCDQEYEEHGSNDWGGVLRRSTEDTLKTTLSLLAAVGRIDLARDLGQRFEEFYALGLGYQERLEALEDQRQVHVDGLAARYRERFADDPAAEARLGARCQGPQRVWTLWTEGNPLETVEQFAEAVDKAFWEEQGGKSKARAQVRRAAKDLTEHLNVLAAVSAPASATVAQNGGRRRRGDWPVKRTQPEVARYLSERSQQYREMAQACLDGRRGARKAFVGVFGQAAIARVLSRRLDGDDQCRPCRSQDVDRTDACQDYIKPLLRKPPRQPQGWAASDSGISAADDIIADIFGGDEE